MGFSTRSLDFFSAAASTVHDFMVFVNEAWDTSACDRPSFDGMPSELRQVVESKEYIDLKYNDPKAVFLESKFKLVGKGVARKDKYGPRTEPGATWGAFVYWLNDIGHQKAAEDEVEALKKEYPIEISPLERDEAIDGAKVDGCFKLSSMGIMGSSDRWTKMTGKLIWNAERKAWFLMPPRARTKGYVLRHPFYIKSKRRGF